MEIVFYPSAKLPKGYCNDHRVRVCLSVNTSHFSHCRSQFKLDPYQTWHDDWLWVGDDAYCWTFRSGDHNRSGPLVST